MQSSRSKNILKTADFRKERLRRLPAWKRPCLHYVKGRIDFRICTNDYKCNKCEFDQYFNDKYVVHAVVKPVSLLNIEGFNIPQGYYLHNGHVWVKIEEGSDVRIGLDDFALRMLGPLDAIEAPLLGKEIKQGSEDVFLQRGKYRTAILSPVSGVVTDVNNDLRETGSIANSDPYASGWIIRVHAYDLRGDLKHLMIGEEAGLHLKNDINNLYSLVEEEIPFAADGGQLGDDIFGHLPETVWPRLSKMFLRTNTPVF